MSDVATPTYETACARIEAIIARLDSGELVARLEGGRAENTPPR